MASASNSLIKPAGAHDRPRLAFLDVARCMAALLVFIEHAIDMLVYHYQGTGPHVGVLGKIGVVLFFIISGFIIPQSLQEGGSNLRFWIRRFFRLYPAYWLAVGVTAVYVHVKHEDLYKPSDFLINLTMLQGFVSRPHVLGVFWTLHLELIFYIACSCLHAMGLLRDHAAFVMSWAIVCCGIGAMAIIMLGERNFPVSSMRLVLMGTVVGLSAQMYCSGRLSLRGLTLIAGGLLASLLVIWSAGRLQFPEEAARAAGRDRDCVGIGVPVFLHAAEHPPLAHAAAPHLPGAHQLFDLPPAHLHDLDLQAATRADVDASAGKRGRLVRRIRGELSPDREAGHPAGPVGRTAVVTALGPRRLCRERERTGAGGIGIL
jgi:hypothetical protein